MERTRRFSTTYLAELSLLVAIIILMAFTPLGYFKTFGLDITLIVIPIAIGAVTLGPKAGAILGATFGITSFVRAVYGMSAFLKILFDINPFGIFVTCIISRALVGWFTGLIFAGLKKTRLSNTVAVFISSLCCPLLNTTLFMSSLVFFFYNTDKIQSLVAKFGSVNPIAFIIAFVGTNGLIEVIVCSIVGGIIAQRLNSALKRRS